MIYLLRHSSDHLAHMAKHHGLTLTVIDQAEEALQRLEAAHDVDLVLVSPADLTNNRKHEGEHSRFKDVDFSKTAAGHALIRMLCQSRPDIFPEKFVIIEEKPEREIPVIPGELHEYNKRMKRVTEQLAREFNIRYVISEHLYHPDGLFTGQDWTIPKHLQMLHDRRATAQPASLAL